MVSSLEKLKNFKDITLDGFHNIDGMNTLINNLPFNRKILICSFLNNKKYSQMLNKTFSILSKNYCGSNE